MSRLRRCIAALLVFAVAGQASAAVTPFLDPLRARHTRLAQLRAKFEQIHRGSSWDADRVQSAGAEFLSEIRATRQLIGRFCAADSRKLEVEFEEIHASIGAMGDAFLMLRTLKGAPRPVLSPSDESAVRTEWGAVIREYGFFKVGERLGVEGLGEILTAGSFREAVSTAFERVRPKLQQEVDREMEQLTGLRFHDRRSLGAAMRAFARRQVEKGVAKLLVKLTTNELIIEWAAGVLIRWIGPKLKEALRPKGNLDARVRVSLGTLEAARRSLNALPGTASLASVGRETRRAEAAIAATRYLTQDLTRSGREAQHGQILAAITRVQSTLSLTARRFPMRDCAELIPGWDEGLDRLERETRRVLAMPLAQPPAPSASAPAPATPPSAAASPASTASSGAAAIAGAWSFGREGGPALCALQLTTTPGAHGLVLRGCHPNESFWRLDSADTIVFVHADGTITSRLTRVDNDYWRGPYVPHPQVPLQGITHYIRRGAGPAAVSPAPSPAVPRAGPSPSGAGGPREWVVYINMEDFACCRYDPGWRDRYPNFKPDETPRTLSIAFLSSAQRDPRRRIVSPAFKTHAEAKAWLCGNHKVVRYGSGTIARVAGLIVALGGICPANSTE